MRTRRVLTGVATVSFVCLILLVAACSPAEPTATPTSLSVSGGTAEPNPSPEPTQESGAAAGFSTSVAARTPIPTPTPHRIERRVDTIAERYGLSGATFLGISASNWAEFAGSVLLVVVGYFAARVLVNRILKWIAGRTKTKLDDEILAEVNDELRWFLVITIAEIGVSGWSFLGDAMRTAVDDLFFILRLVILTSMNLGLIRFAGNHYKATLETPEDRKRLDPVIISIQRFAYFLVLIVAVSIGLAHFGADANALYITLLITGLIVALAAREIIADALSGFIILADQPFREGDSVYIKDMDTWGDVLDIGTRTTRIRTVDNRELIVPNSKISQSQIVNYNYPDTRYRLETDVRIAYGTDIKLVRKTAVDAVRAVAGVLEDEPVDVLFIEFDDSARKVRVRWWIETFHDEWHALDRVNAALESAFKKAGIEVPVETFALRVDKENGADDVSRPNLTASQDDETDDQS
ncbi:MAG: mechanosensitive ion channel family protein [Chloroflexota bacterium]|nr:MAG: mechanosensitive ion channel family protein [Chloroflexota bacterium]